MTEDQTEHAEEENDVVNDLFNFDKLKKDIAEKKSVKQRHTSAFIGTSASQRGVSEQDILNQRIQAFVGYAENDDANPSKQIERQRAPSIIQIKRRQLKEKKIQREQAIIDVDEESKQMKEKLNKYEEVARMKAETFLRETDIINDQANQILKKQEILKYREEMEKEEAKEQNNGE